MKTNPSTEYALLGALMSGPKHGYEILKFFDQFLKNFWIISSSQLYLLLKKLEKQNLVQSILESQETRPSKRVFSLTPKGRQHFLEWVQSPVMHVRDLRIEFLAKLFFCTFLGVGVGGNLVQAQTEVLLQIKKKVTRQQAKENDSFQKLVLNFKMTSLNIWITWLEDEAISYIKEFS